MAKTNRIILSPFTEHSKYVQALNGIHIYGKTTLHSLATIRELLFIFEKNPILVNIYFYKFVYTFLIYISSIRINLHYPAKFFFSFIELVLLY